MSQSLQQHEQSSAPTHRSEAFDREAVLPALIGLWPSELKDYSARGTRRLIALLHRKLRAERQRGRSGHWCYDLTRHLALAEALKNEQERLRQLLEQDRLTNSKDGEERRLERHKPPQAFLQLHQPADLPAPRAASSS